MNKWKQWITADLAFLATTPFDILIDTQWWIISQNTDWNLPWTITKKQSQHGIPTKSNVTTVTPLRHSWSCYWFFIHERKLDAHRNWILQTSAGTLQGRRPGTHDNIGLTKLKQIQLRWNQQLTTHDVNGSETGHLINTNSLMFPVAYPVQYCAIAQTFFSLIADMQIKVVSNLILYLYMPICVAPVAKRAAIICRGPTSEILKAIDHSFSKESEPPGTIVFFLCCLNFIFSLHF